MMLTSAFHPRMAVLLAVIAFGVFSSVHAGHPHTPPIKGSHMIADENREYAEQMFKEYPKLFPKERRSSILHGIILIGMTPFEAKLAGGAFFIR
ncbi:hypothetical protein LPH50_04850 [Xylella taiwanensis]|uniref:Uncharacterized protein n=3 Tax=Xylella taiwanensis TaxID=1444770 RepID=Z9JGK1_9GAMM|nr:hypothetical protein [Xylella taiwanensis]EWS77133.1 hypothetical protein AF72_12500 [Xylella taiwanensis]MCD8455310.1 hypothetical protein [Xylella taiwanensis]MCD8457715.1 hypothetical protein [Xylella taiwanensis]MCD8459852.1 hypothetical protein [Xylella taiwanensis]MCD8464357.1 hypothetical protein [Xylella taiwanensis]